MGDGKELDIPHVQSLIEQVERQVKAALSDAFRHVMVHLGVEPDHPSMGVVKEEVLKRIRDTLNEYEPQPPHDYGQ